MEATKGFDCDYINNEERRFQASVYFVIQNPGERCQVFCENDKLKKKKMGFEPSLKFLVTEGKFNESKDL